MDTTNPTARAMALVHELTKAEGVSDDLRARAIKLITEVAPETLEPNFDPLTAIVKLGALVRERKEAAELRTRLGDGVVVLRELDPNSDVVKDVAKFVNALNEGTASTQTPAKVFTRKDMKRVNFLTGEGVAEAKEKALSILLDAYRGDIALFAKQVFGAKLTPEQITFCEEFRTERTITRHEPPAWGKTYVAAIAVWWSLVCFDDVKVTIFGPSESLIKTACGAISKPCMLVWHRRSKTCLTLAQLAFPERPLPLRALLNTVSFRRTTPVLRAVSTRSTISCSWTTRTVSRK